MLIWFDLNFTIFQYLNIQFLSFEFDYVWSSDLKLTISKIEKD